MKRDSNIDAKGDDGMIPKMLFGPCTVLDGYMYSFTFAGGVFARMDLATGAVELLETTFDCILGRFPASLMLTVGRSVYVLAFGGRYLAEYCVDTKQVKETEIGCYYRREGASIAGWFAKEDKIYIYPIGQREEVIYDRMSHAVSKRKLGGKISFSPFRICPADDYVYIFEESGNHVIRRNIDTGIEDIFTLNDRLEKVRHIVHKDDHLYILTAKREIYEWGGCSNDLKLLCKSKTDDIALNMAVLKDKIIIPPYRGEEIQVVNTESGAVSFLKEQPADFTHHPAYDIRLYSNCCEDQNNFYFAAHTTNYVLVISKKNGEISWIRPLIAAEDIIGYLFKRNYYLTQEICFDFSSFLTAVEDKTSRDTAQSACIGNEIFKEIVNELRQ